MLIFSGCIESKTLVLLSFVPLAWEEDGDIRIIEFREIDHKHPLIRDHQFLMFVVWIGGVNSSDDDVLGVEEAITEC